MNLIHGICSTSRWGGVASVLMRGREALELLAGHSYDMNMLGMSGGALYRRIAHSTRRGGEAGMDEAPLASRHDCDRPPRQDPRADCQNLPSVLSRPASRCSPTMGLYCSVACGPFLAYSTHVWTTSSCAPESAFSWPRASSHQARRWRTRSFLPRSPA